MCVTLICIDDVVATYSNCDDTIGMSENRNVDLAKPIEAHHRL